MHISQVEGATRKLPFHLDASYYRCRNEIGINRTKKIHTIISELARFIPLNNPNDISLSTAVHKKIMILRQSIK